MAQRWDRFWNVKRHHLFASNTYYGLKHSIQKAYCFMMMISRYSILTKEFITKQIKKNNVNFRLLVYVFYFFSSIFIFMLFIFFFITYKCSDNPPYITNGSLSTKQIYFSVAFIRHQLWRKYSNWTQSFILDGMRRLC